MLVSDMLMAVMDQSVMLMLCFTLALLIPGLHYLEKKNKKHYIEIILTDNTIVMWFTIIENDHIWAQFLFSLKEYY